MARVPEAELERLKAEVSVQRLAEARGVELRRHGADLIGLCPFHEDHEPSLVISPSEEPLALPGGVPGGGIGGGLGDAGRGGELPPRGGAAPGGPSPFAAPPLAPARPVKVSTVRRLPAPVERDADDQELLLQVLRYYHATLQEFPEALRYLESRGLRSSELIERFQLGFANRTLGLRLPEKTRRAGEEIRTRLQRLGILREVGPRALQRLAGDPGDRSRGEGCRGVRAQDHRRVARRDAAAPVPARAAPGCLERGSARRLPRRDPL